MPGHQPPAQRVDIRSDCVGRHGPDLLLPIRVAVEIANLNESSASGDGERSSIVRMDQQCRDSPVGVFPEMFHQQQYRSGGVPPPTMRSEHVVAEVDLIMLEPGTVVIEVDPSDDIPIHDNARGRLRRGRSLTKKREELSITSCHENRDIIIRRTPKRHDPIRHGLLQHDLQSAPNHHPGRQYFLARSSGPSPEPARRANGLASTMSEWTLLPRRTGTARLACDHRLSQEGEVPPDVPQVCPLLLQDHAHAVTDGWMPVPAAPRVVALLGEQLRRGSGQEVGHHLLPFGSRRKDVVERRQRRPGTSTCRSPSRPHHRRSGRSRGTAAPSS